RRCPPPSPYTTLFRSIQPGTGQAPASSPAYWKKVNRYTVRWDGDTDAAGTVVFEPGDYKQSVPIELVEPLVAGEMLAILGAFDRSEEHTSELQSRENL